MGLFARTCSYDVMGAERLAARLFVAIGGIWWTISVAAAALIYGEANLFSAVLQALFPLALTIIAFGVGLRYENVAALILFVGAFLAVIWGVIARWEPGVWLVMFVILIGPAVIAGILYLLASQMQQTCELRERRADGGYA